MEKVARYGKYKKCPVSNAHNIFNNVRNIFGIRLFIFGYCLVHDHLDLHSIYFFKLFVHDRLDYVTQSPRFDRLDLGSQI